MKLEDLIKLYETLSNLVTEMEVSGFRQPVKSNNNLLESVVNCKDELFELIAAETHNPYH